MKKKPQVEKVKSTISSILLFFNISHNTMAYTQEAIWLKKITLKT